MKTLNNDRLWENWKTEQNKPCFYIRGQVIEIAPDLSGVLCYITGLMDDDKQQWLPLLPLMPLWALHGIPFLAEISEDVETFEQLRDRPWAIKNFLHTPHPDRTDEELKSFLGV